MATHRIQTLWPAPVRNRIKRWASPTSSLSDNPSSLLSVDPTSSIVSDTLSSESSVVPSFRSSWDGLHPAVRRRRPLHSIRPRENRKCPVFRPPLLSVEVQATPSSEPTTSTESDSPSPQPSSVPSQLPVCVLVMQPEDSAFRLQNWWRR